MGDGVVNKYMVRKDTQTHRGKSRLTGRQKYKCSYKHTYIHTHTDTYIYNTHRWVDRYMDKYRYIYIYIYRERERERER